MNIYIHSAPKKCWYRSLKGKILEDVWIGPDGHFHVYENLFDTYKPTDLPIGKQRGPEHIGLLYVDCRDAMILV